jgi:hypothetical protein
MENSPHKKINSCTKVQLIEFNEVKNVGRSLYETECKWENQAKKLCKV